jgi:hypothetical protein
MINVGVALEVDVGGRSLKYELDADCSQGAEKALKIRENQKSY